MLRFMSLLDPRVRAVRCLLDPLIHGTRARVKSL